MFLWKLFFFKVLWHQKHFGAMIHWHPVHYEPYLLPNAARDRLKAPLPWIEQVGWRDGALLIILENVAVLFSSSSFPLRSLCIALLGAACCITSLSCWIHPSNFFYYFKMSLAPWEDVLIRRGCWLQSVPVSSVSPAFKELSGCLWRRGPQESVSQSQIVWIM